MDNRIFLVTFIVLAFTFVFTFVFGWQALAEENLFYGICATIGFILSLVVCLAMGTFIREEGSLAAWYFGYALIIGIVFVWYLTRVGTFFGFW